MTEFEMINTIETIADLLQKEQVKEAQEVIAEALKKVQDFLFDDIAGDRFLTEEEIDQLAEECDPINLDEPEQWEW